MRITAEQPSNLVVSKSLVSSSTEGEEASESVVNIRYYNAVSTEAVCV